MNNRYERRPAVKAKAMSNSRAIQKAMADISPVYRNGEAFLYDVRDLKRGDAVKPHRLPVGLSRAEAEHNRWAAITERAAEYIAMSGGYSARNIAKVARQASTFFRTDAASAPVMSSAIAAIERAGLCSSSA